MIINNGNIHEVNNISLHDACFESFVFDRVHNRLETAATSALSSGCHPILTAANHLNTLNSRESALPALT